MSSFQLLDDEIAQQINSVSNAAAADSTIAAKVLLESALEALSRHDTGNVVVADGSKSLFSKLFACFP